MRAALLTAVLALVPALAGAQQPCTSNADSVVDAIYRQVLERPAGGDANARAEQLRNGQTSVREIVRDVARSQEHERFLPANDRPQAVTNLYRHVLGRDPDAAGLNSHVQGRIALVALVDTFINSRSTSRSSATAECQARRFVTAATGTRRLPTMAATGSGTWTATGMAPSSARNGMAIRPRSSPRLEPRRRADGR